MKCCNVNFLKSVSHQIKDWLIGHISTVHEGKKISNEKLFFGICGENFASVQRLNGHIAKVHARNSNSEENSNDQIENLEKKKKENDCPVCDSTFPTESELNLHAWSMHEIENLEEFENFGLFSKDDLQQINETVKKSLEYRDWTLFAQLPTGGIY